MKSYYTAIKTNANEEWPEMMSVATTTDATLGKTQIVRTMQEPKKSKEVDLKRITSADDLNSLKAKDPFSYYSIPGVRSAMILMQDIDTSNLASSPLLDRSCTSCPSRLQSVQGPAMTQQTVVTRSSRISFECHPDLLLEDDLMSDDTEEDDIDLDMFMATFNQKQP